MSCQNHSSTLEETPAALPLLVSQQQNGYYETLSSLFQQWKALISRNTKLLIWGSLIATSFSLAILVLFFTPQCRFLTAFWSPSTRLDSNFKNQTSADNISSSSNSTTCVTDTQSSCYFMGCFSQLGPTDCIDKRCMCRPGYCFIGKRCVGCSHIVVALNDLPQQADKQGNYSAVSTYFSSDRPVWKKMGGTNWIWYCGKDSCWIVSDIGPNDQFCKAGLVSPPSEKSTDPIYTVNGAWRFWNHQEWVNDDANPPHIQIYCSD